MRVWVVAARIALSILEPCVGRRIGLGAALAWISVFPSCKLFTTHTAVAYRACRAVGPNVRFTARSLGLLIALVLLFDADCAGRGGQYERLGPGEARRAFRDDGGGWGLPPPPSAVPPMLPVRRCAGEIGAEGPLPRCTGKDGACARSVFGGSRKRPRTAAAPPETVSIASHSRAQNA